MNALETQWLSSYATRIESPMHSLNHKQKLNTKTKILCSYVKQDFNLHLMRIFLTPHLQLTFLPVRSKHNQVHFVVCASWFSYLLDALGDFQGCSA